MENTQTYSIPVVEEHMKSTIGHPYTHQYNPTGATYLLTCYSPSLG